MSEGSVRVWLALDPAEAQVRVMLNQTSVGRVVGAGNQFAINMEPEYAHLRSELISYCSALFANMPETLQLAVYEAPAFATNAAGGDAMPSVPDSLKRLVHLGCGPDLRPGWLNIDYRPGGAGGYDPATGFLNYDLRRGLPPLADDSVEMVFSSHFFEHLRHEEAILLMKDCKRALRPGGVARFQMPNFALAFRSYCANDREYLETGLGYKLLDHMPEYARNYADMISHTVYESYTHKYIWDEENLTKALLELGYRDVEVVDHDDAYDHPSPARRAYSFYVMATA